MDGTVGLMIVVSKLTYFAFYYCDNRIEKFPSFVYFIGFIYFYPTSIIGPAFDFTDYMNFIFRRDIYKNIPSTIRPALKSLLLGIFYIAGVVFIIPHLDKHVVLSDWFKELNFFYKLVIMNLVGISIRFRYFAAWHCCQAGVNGSGISFNGVDENGNYRFDRIEGMREPFELEKNAKVKTEMWNTSV
jgi:lysophospholipid acyltransferase